ncbi:hypothetical protein [Bifidobacterium samirii]|uniref:Uncharacterized protein n=1 Tax=Bifidobacterium samirii TaxID=2306974 RepID=A0A430FJN4_9BIFI|nr:hypothetical protein [Bifidobacterium samirii]RSX53037.1 hypothetical protein D2E24_1708 [Bifidobacterium samirii]
MSRLITHGQQVAHVLMDGRRATVIHDGQVLVWDRANLVPRFAPITASGVSWTFDGTSYHCVGTPTAWGSMKSKPIALQAGRYSLARTVGWRNGVLYPEIRVSRLDGTSFNESPKIGVFDVDHEQTVSVTLVHAPKVVLDDDIIPILQKVD